MSVALSVVGLMKQRGAVVRGDLVGAVRIGDVDGAGALRAEAERVGAVDGDVDAAVEIVGAVLALLVGAGRRRRRWRRRRR